MFNIDEPRHQTKLPFAEKRQVFTVHVLFTSVNFMLHWIEVPLSIHHLFTYELRFLFFNFKLSLRVKLNF